MLALLVAPASVAGTSLVPVSVVTAGVVAASASAVLHADAARAAGPTVLILSTSVNGGSASMEAQAASAAGATVTIATPSAWDAMTTAQFKAYSAIVIGDPSSGGTCASTVPSDALSTAGAWGAAVTGNVAVLGTAPALAGSAGGTLITDGMKYAVAGSGTGLYVSLNCEYSSAAAGTAVPVLASVDGGGFAVTGQSSSCPSNAGTVNTWAAVADGQFNGLTSAALGPWTAPACSVQESFTAWPAGLTGLGYDKAASPALFTASDGASAGQAYVLAGVVPSAGTAALAPSAGGEVPVGTTAGGGNPAAPGVSQPAAGDPVNTENGDFSQSATDVSIPTFGPAIDFSRTYDAVLAQEQTRTGTPGALGYGWTDNWATSLSSAGPSPAPGSIYTLSGLATDTGNGFPATQAPLSLPGGVIISGGNVYIADTAENRVQEVPGSSGTQWGISMTAGDMYTIAGSASGASGRSGDGGPARSALLDGPRGLAFDAAGNLYIADALNNRVQEVAKSSGSQWGQSMTANDVYTVVGSASGSQGDSGDGGAASAALLNSPVGLATVPGGSDLYIADEGNNRIQEIAAQNGTQWGQSMTTGDIYTVAGSASGGAGMSGDSGPATSALLDGPQGLGLDSAGDLYIADSNNNRIQEVPKASGTQWSQSMTAAHIYTVAGSASGGRGLTGDGGSAASALLAWPSAVVAGNGGQLYICDYGNNRIQEVAGTTHTEWGRSMTAGDIYTIAGSASGSGGFSGDGGAATSALLVGPFDLGLDSSANLYIADYWNDRVREVSAATAKISTAAGDGGTLPGAGNDGPATSAQLSEPGGTAIDAAGDVYIADSGNNRVQEIAAANHTQWGIAMTAGDVYTVAGCPDGVQGDTGDGGPATAALLDDPVAVALDAAGDLYIADLHNDQVREVPASAGTQWGQSMTAGDIYTVAGSSSGPGDSGDGGPATSALLNLPAGVAVDKSGNLYIADYGNNRVQEAAAVGGTQWGESMTAGDIYTVTGSATGTPGSSGDGGAASSALLRGPSGVAIDPAGNLYAADSGNNRIQEVAAATGSQRGATLTKNDIYTIAGSASGSSGSAGDGGPATSALLNDPTGVAADSSGNIYAADAGNSRVQEVAAANGTQWSQPMTVADVYTVAGSATGASGESGDGGTATAALLSGVSGVATDQAGDLYLADPGGNRLREVAATALPTISAPPGQQSALAPSPGGITVTQPDGSQVTFYSETGGNCTAPYVQAGGYCTLPQDVSATLRYNSGPGTFTFSPRPGVSYTYTSNGVLTSESDAAGDTLTVSYGSPTPGSGNCPAAAFACDTVTSASGRALTLGMSSAGLVTSVTDPMGRTWTYGYAGSDLTKVTDPLGNVTTYTYGSGSTGNPLLANDLLTLTGPNEQPGGPDAGDATVNVYDATGRVTSQTDPMGFKTTFSYCVNAATGDCMNASTGTGTVTVADPDGNTTVYSYAAGVLTAESAWTGGTTLTSEQDYVPDTTAGGASGGTLLGIASADGNGNITTSTYDAAGNVTSSTAPDGVASQTATVTARFTALNQQSCAGDTQAATPCSSSETGPAPVAQGGVITPPSAAPPPGVTYALYDTDGNQLYTTSGVYEPGSSTAAYTQTSYQLFKGNSITLNGASISCASTPPSVSLPCATINPDGVVTQLGYDAQGDLTSTSTPDGNAGGELAKTTYAYDGDGEQTSATSPDGNLAGATAANYTTATVYNGDGQKTSVTQAGGSGATVTPRTTSYGHDASGNQTSVKYPRGNTTTTTYNADDQPTLITNPAGDATLTCYDGDGNAAQTVPPVGVAAHSLTPASCPASYPSGFSDRLATDATTTTFDVAGQKTAMTTPAPVGQSGPQTTTYTYDASGNVLTTTAPPATGGGSNQVTVNSYDSAGQLASQTTGYGTPVAATTTYCYDPAGDQTSVVMPDGNTSGTAACETSSPWVVSSASYPTQAAYQTTSGYDSQNEIVSTTSPATSAAPNGATTTYTYDQAGNKITTTDPNGVVTTLTLSPLNLVDKVSYSGGSPSSATFGYDAEGHEISAANGSGSLTYTYDPFGELTGAANSTQTTAYGYGYDADGNLASITYPLPSTASWATGDSVTYGYNNADQLTSVTDFNQTKTTITPNADGLPSSEALGSTGDTISTSYGDSDDTSSISLKNSSSTLQSFSYSYAPAGDVTSETDTPSSSTSPASYSYDANGRVTSMTPGSGSRLNYGFDASGNLTTLAWPAGSSGTYDHNGELTASTTFGSTTNYAYDADGQQLKATQGSSTTSSATWDGTGELTSFDDGAADMTAASYYADGLRATAATGTRTQNFVWDTSSSIPRLLMDSVNAYIYGGGQVPLEQVNLSTGTITYLISDSQGSIRGTVNSSGALTGSTSYDAWGNPETTGGLTGATPFGYAGGYTDPTGLIYLINRYYNPATGQFLSVDPAVANTNTPYAYAHGDPVNEIDPTGLFSWHWVFSPGATWGHTDINVCITVNGIQVCAIVSIPHGEIWEKALIKEDDRNHSYVDVYQVAAAWQVARCVSVPRVLWVYYYNGHKLWVTYSNKIHNGCVYSATTPVVYAYKKGWTVVFHQDATVNAELFAQDNEGARYLVNRRPSNWASITLEP